LFGSPEGICVLGEVDIQTGQVRGYVEDVSISGFKIPSIDLTGTRDATATKNRVFRHSFKTTGCG
jgi:hypothetical protein